MPLLPLVLLLFLAACEQSTPSEKTHLPSHRYHYIAADSLPALAFQQMVYVPIYSDIYHDTGEKRFPLTATLSVRNTSPRDTMYVSAVDYYDSQGALQRQYLRQPIRLHALESVEFVVEHAEDKGGAGANFLVSWGAGRTLQPIIQAVMIGTTTQQGISFVTEGVVVEMERRD